MDKDIVGRIIRVGDFAALIAPNTRRVAFGIVLKSKEDKFRVQRAFWNDFFSRWQLFKSSYSFESDSLFVLPASVIPLEARTMLKEFLKEYKVREKIKDDIRATTR